jgi:hypothetical protein
LVLEPTLSAEVACALKQWKPERDSMKQLPVSLVKPVKTRWSSYVKALRRLLVLWKPVWRLQEADEWKKAWNRVLCRNSQSPWLTLFSFYFRITRTRKIFFRSKTVITTQLLAFCNL